MLQQLAYENANADCQAALDSICTQAKSIAEFIKVCQNVGTETHKAQILVAIMRPTSNSHGCVKCGKLGHIQKDCHQQIKGQFNKLPNKDCPKFGKGKHRANQCRSKFVKEVKPLSGNKKTWVSSHAPNPKVDQNHADFRSLNILTLGQRWVSDL